MSTEQFRTLYLVATLPQAQPLFGAPLAPEAPTIASAVKDAHLAGVEFSCHLGMTDVEKETARLLIGSTNAREVERAVGFGTYDLPEDLPAQLNLAGVSHREAYVSAPEDLKRSMRSCGIANWGAIRGFPGVHLGVGQSALVCMHHLLIELAFAAVNGGEWPEWLSINPGDIHRIRICVEGTISHDEYRVPNLSDF